MSKIKNLTGKTKVGVLASGAVIATILVTAPVAGAAPAAPPAPASGGSQVQGTTVDTPVPGQPNAILGHSKPDSVTTTYKDGEKCVTLYYHWNIKAFHPLVLPAMTPPDGTSYVARNGTERKFDGDNEGGRIGGTAYVAAVKVQASEGVGYGSFRYPTMSDRPGSSQKDAWVMTGWPEGGAFSNNAWAGLDDGTFDLTVTFTSDVNHSAGETRNPAEGGIFWADNQLVFPWA